MRKNEFEMSVIIPTHNRGDILRKCLDALTNQTISSESFEVIVSDDGSQDNTQEITKSFAGRKLRNVQYLRQPCRGAGAARNFAIRESKGRLLLLINDDTITTGTLIEEHLRTHKSYPEEIYAVLGRITISNEIPPSIFAKMHLDVSFRLLHGEKELDWRAFFTCNLSVKKSFLFKYGLFEEKIQVLHEDIELAERLSHHGLKIIYNPQALGYHYHYIDEKVFFRTPARKASLS